MLIDNTIVVITQVLILFLLVGVGLVTARLKWINEHGISQMTQLLLFVVTPCVIVDSFQTEFSKDLLSGLLISLISAIGAHLLGILIGKFAFRGQSESDNKILRFAVVFSNCGFMCIPLLYAILGPIGVFYGSVYIAVYNVFQWTYGIVIMTGDRSGINARKALLNPGTIGIIAGLFLFLTGITLPEVPGTVVSNLAALNTPLAMVIIGAQMSKTSIFEIWKSKLNYQVAFWRLLVIPMVVLLGLVFLPVDRDLLLACVIPACAPTAAVTALFATRFRQNVLLATHTVALTTVLSIVSMPLLILVSDSLRIMITRV